jgi:hypothetical protein
MSAAELIEEVKRLSPEERERLINSILQLDDPFASDTKSQSIQWPDTFHRARLIMGEGTLPNLVLQERESNSY